MKVDQARIDQTDVATFVHDRRPAEGAGHLGRHFVVPRAVRGGVKRQTLAAFGEGDVGFVEDGRPLKGGACRSSAHRTSTHVLEGDSTPTVHDLTSATVAEFGQQRLLPVQLVLDLSALALGRPLDLAELLGRLDAVGRPLLPRVTFALGRAWMRVARGMARCRQGGIGRRHDPGGGVGVFGGNAKTKSG